VLFLVTEEEIKENEKWKDVLTEKQFEVTRLKGTEMPFSSDLNANKETGTYKCVCCKEGLFSSECKFDSGTGWPSFYQPIENSLKNQEDQSMSRMRIEVMCKNCGAHLGHVFDDGPKITGKRFCINGVALEFEKSKMNDLD